MIARAMLVAAAIAAGISAVYHASRAGIAKDQLQDAQGGVTRAKLTADVIINLLLGAASCGISILCLAAI